MVYMDSDLKIHINPSQIEEARILKWMIKGKSTLIQKKKKKRNNTQQLQTDNMSTYDQEILIAEIREEIYYLLACHRLFPEEQKECHKGIRGTYYLQYKDKHIFKEVKTRHKM